MNYIASIFCTFIICHSPQKSSTAQKVYKPNREPLLDSTSPSRLTPCHLPYRGEALGAVERSETERLYEGKPFLCRKVRLLASPVSFWQIICYNGFAALPAHLFGRGGEKNGKYSFFYTVCRSKCSSLLYLQVA